MTKQELRAACKEKRAAISPEQKKEMDLAILKRIASSNVFAKASSILIYAPREGEINLLPLVKLAHKRGIPVGFPKCDTETLSLRFYALEPERRLVRGTYNIPEPPADAKPCPIDRNTLCILPGLCFDPTGGRLGYGKGYYDRFLESFPGVRAAAVYQSMMVKKVPTEPHDKPVSLLFTEHECWDCRKSPQKNARGSILDKVSAGLASARDWTAEKLRKATLEKRALAPTSPEESDATKTAALPTAQHAPVILVAVTYALLLFSRLIDSWITNPILEPFVVILLQLLIFLAPAAVFLFKLRPKSYWKSLQLNPIGTSKLLFLLFMLAVMITGGLLTEIMTGGIASLAGNFTLYDTFVARASGGLELFFLVIAYCLLPAVCEELLFRGILCTEYRHCGATLSILISAFFFAMLHFSFPLFPTYLFLGILLACVRYATNSLIAAAVLHFLYNLFCLFGQPYLSTFYVHAGSNETFVFCLTVLFLLFSAFAAGEARKIYHVYAKRRHDPTTVVPIRAIPKHLFYALRTPATAVCIALWLIVAAVNLAN